MSSRVIDMTWQDNATDEDRYIVERSIGDNLNFLPVVSNLPPDTQFYRDGPLPDGDYYYRVKAANAAGESLPSNEVGPLSIPNYVGLAKSADLGQSQGDLAGYSAPIQHTQTGLRFDALIEWNGNADTQLRTIGGRWIGTGSNRSWRVGMFQPSKSLQCSISLNGTTANHYTSDPFPIVPNIPIWIRVTRAFGSGDVKFYYRNRFQSAWTQIGNTRSGVSGELHDPPGVGAGIGNTFQFDNVNAQWQGRIYDAIAYEWSTLQELFRFSPTDAEAYGTGVQWISSGYNQEVWDAEGTSRISAVNQYVQDSFSDDDNTIIGDHDPDIDVVGGGWVMYTGENTHEIVSNKLKRINRNNTAIEINTSNDYKAVVETSGHTSGGCGLTMRVSAVPADILISYFRCQCTNAGLLELYENSVKQATSTGNSVKNGKYTAAINNGWLSMMDFDGVSISYQSNAYNTETGAGVFIFNDFSNAGGRLDNYEVTVIEDNPL